MKFNSLQEIKDAVDRGEKVYWVHDGYEVWKDPRGDYWVTFIYNRHTIGLSYMRDGQEVLQGDLRDFYQA